VCIINFNNCLRKKENKERKRKKRKRKEAKEKEKKKSIYFVYTTYILIYTPKRKKIKKERSTPKPIFF